MPSASMSPMNIRPHLNSSTPSRRRFIYWKIQIRAQHKRRGRMLRATTYFKVADAKLPNARANPGVGGFFYLRSVIDYERIAK